MTENIEYEDLTIHQRISLKEMIISKRARHEIGVKSPDKLWQLLHTLAILNKSWKESINHFLKRIDNE